MWRVRGGCGGSGLGVKGQDGCGRQCFTITALNQPQHSPLNYCHASQPPQGDAHKRKEIVQDVTLHDLDSANARPQVGEAHRFRTQGLRARAPLALCQSAATGG